LGILQHRETARVGNVCRWHADFAAQRIKKFSLGEAVRSKFNEVSQRVGSEVSL
jgi:hypothetical protein